MKSPLNQRIFRPSGRSAAPVVAGAFALAAMTAQAQHVHGVIDLGVVVEDSTIVVSLDAPLSDVVGFEHAPRNEQQTSQLEQAATLLADAGAMFGLPESAECSLAGSSIEAPEYLQALIEGRQAGEAEHDHHDHDDHSHDHEDQDDHEHDHDKDHDHDHSAEHAELNASFEWTCGNVSDLDSVGLGFVSGFVSVETINVQVLTSGGAKVLTLSGKDTSLPLSGR